MTQLLLDLGHRPALGREDFLVAPSNEVAVEWIDRWPDWPQPGLTLYGAPGAGKTHLTQVWQAASGAVALAGHGLLSDDPPELLGEAQACVVEGAEDLQGETEGGCRVPSPSLLTMNSIAECCWPKTGRTTKGSSRCCR